MGTEETLESGFSNLPASKTFLGHLLKCRSLTLISRHLEFLEKQSESLYFKETAIIRQGWETALEETRWRGGRGVEGAGLEFEKETVSAWAI